MRLAFGLYYPANSWIHRLPAGCKLAALIIWTTLLFTTANLWLLVPALLCTVLLYAVATIPLALFWRSLQPALFFAIIIALAQVFLEQWLQALSVSIRFVAVLLAATLVTLTTKVSAMTDCIVWCLRPISRWLDTRKIALAISLVIRFVPLVDTIRLQIQQAQKSRGGRNPLVVIAAVIVRVLRMGDEITQALEARGFE